MDLDKGITEINKELIIKPNYTFDEFKRTKYYTNQDGIRIINLEGPQCINNRNYIVSIFFRDGIIYMLSLIGCDEEYKAEDEPKRKEYHDRILEELGVHNNEEYTWGSIKSIYDARSNLSSINITYR